MHLSVLKNVKNGFSGCKFVNTKKNLHETILCTRNIDKISSKLGQHLPSAGYFLPLEIDG